VKRASLVGTGHKWSASGAGERSDLVHTGAGQPAFGKDLTRRIEDASVDLAGKLTWRRPERTG
jgi:hypothetical protein